jgi:hypothetical protein
VQADLDVPAKHAAGAGVLGKAVQAGKRIGRDGGADPLDGVAIVIVVGGLDHHEMK